MQAGTLIAVVIAILIFLAIWWFMTRAGRARAARRYSEASGGADAAERGAPDGRDGSSIRTESAGAGSVATHVPASQGQDTFAGAKTTGASVHAGAVGAATAGATAAAAAAALADQVSTSATDPDPTASAGHDEHGHPNSGRTSAPVAKPADSVLQRGDQAMHERPRFDPSIDGHPVPGDAPDEANANPPVADRAPANPTRADATHAATGSMRSPDMSSLPSAQPALTGDFTVNSGNALTDAREMMKILNLRESEAGRLGLSSEQFGVLWQGRRDGIDDDTLTSVADRLRRMIR